MNRIVTQPLFVMASLLAAASLFATSSHAATTSTVEYFDMNFNNPVQSNNGYDSQLGGYYTGLSYDFRNVAPTSGASVDLRLSVSINNPDYYSFIGSYPDFNASPSGNDGDLGFEYQYNGEGKVHGGASWLKGGITYHMSFYEGDGTFSKEFVIPNFRLLIYDVDGDEAQSETVRVFSEDGFSGYQLPSSGGITMTQNSTLGSFSFTGPGVNHAETDASGAFILHFQNTSEINLVMEAVTKITKNTSATANGVFSAIDGDMGLIRETEFQPITPVPVPEPSSALLVLSAGALSWMMGRRRTFKF